MKNLTKKIVISALIAVMVIAMAGCGKKDTVTIDKNSVYREEPLNIHFEGQFSPTTIEVVGDKLYFCGYQYDSQTFDSKNIWGTVSLDGSDYKENVLSNDSWIDRMLVLDDGNVILFNLEYYEDNSDPDNYIYESKYLMTLYDPAGKELKQVDLNEEAGIQWLNNVVKVDSNSFLVDTYEQKLFYDNSLNLIRKAEADGDNDYYNFLKLRDGSTVTTKWDDDGEAMYRYDLANLKVGEKIDIPFEIDGYGMYQGTKDYDLLFRTSTEVLGYNIGDAAPVTIMNFINSDISTSYFTYLVQDKDGSFIGAYNDWDDEDNSFKFYRYTKVAPEDVKEKKILTLGCFYFDSDVRKDVISFNKSSDDYRIVVTDYSQFSTYDDWEAGIKKFNTDIASGQGPDIIISNGGVSIEDYMSKGLFVDLTDYIKNDPEIDYDDIFPNLIEVSSYKGKMYELIPSFYIQTVIGKTSLLNGKTSWNFEEFNQFVKSLPEGMDVFSEKTRDSFIYSALSINASQFVDIANAQCHFDTPEFIGLLEFAKTLPKEIDYMHYEDYDYEASATAFRDNRVALMPIGLSTFYDYNYQLKGNFGEPITFIGYPTKEGNGSALSYSTSYAISSKCKQKDAAWQLIRKQLLPEAQAKIEYGVPASMKRFDELGERAKQRPYYMDGDVKVEYDDTYYMGGQEITLTPCTDAEVAYFKDFIMSVNKLAGDLTDLEIIIEEEAEAFFEGQKTAEEAAKIIQSRASIYINEKQ